MCTSSETKSDRVIEVNDLAKEYRVYDKPEGLWATGSISQEKIE